jgi:hypothetical protein
MNFFVVLVNSLPAITKLIDKFFVFYLEYKQKKQDEKFLQAVDDIRSFKDQRAMDYLVGNAAKRTNRKEVQTRTHEPKK